MLHSDSQVSTWCSGFSQRASLLVEEEKSLLVFGTVSFIGRWCVTADSPLCFLWLASLCEDHTNHVGSLPLSSSLSTALMASGSRWPGMCHGTPWTCASSTPISSRRLPSSWLAYLTTMDRWAEGWETDCFPSSQRHSRNSGSSELMVRAIAACVSVWIIKASMNTQQILQGAEHIWRQAVLPLGL